MSELEGQVAVVTGAAGGIGQAYARGLCEAGARVVVADIDGGSARSVATRLESDGYEALSVELDVTSARAAEAMVRITRERFGRIDILVNNAALMAQIPRDGLLDVPLEWWDRVMRVNVLGALICCRAVVPLMKERGGGKIINTASDAAFLPGGFYRISKLALVGLTAGLAVELGPHNINVNAIAPGLIQSEAGFRSAGAVGSEMRTARYAQVPHARPDRLPGDLVGLLLLLASPAGDFINGQTINIDGGRVIRL